MKNTIHPNNLDFENAIDVISFAQKFIIPIPKGKGEPLVYPEGHEKEGQAITDWQGKPIGDEGIVFFNEKDKSYRAVPSDGNGVVILNQVNSEQAKSLEQVLSKLKEPLSVNAIKASLMYASKDLGISDMYNSDMNFILAKMSPIGDGVVGKPGLFKLDDRDIDCSISRNINKVLFKRDDRDICQAIFLEGSGEFQGPAATPQKFENGAVIVKQGDDIRLVQSDIFCQTYTQVDGAKIDPSVMIENGAALKP
jgi:hypothetical protein